MQSGRLGVAALGLVLAGCARSMTSSTPTPAADWKVLFDGGSTAAWRGYGMDSLPSGWRIVDGTLSRVAPGGDIITREKYANFELTLEWKISEGGNSGIFYRASEDTDAIYWSAPEMQVLDDARHPDGHSRLTAAGSDYGLYPSPPGVVKPAGEWNAVRILVNGNHVEHWLNGVKVVEYELGSADWEAKVKASKFAPHPHYGRNALGYIGLQDHGDAVSYRNIKIRVLP
jgi:3-keto-disaccharide hydrolase